MRDFKAFYEKQFNKVEKELRKLVGSDAELQAKMDKVETIKGLGFMTIIKVLAEVNGFLLFKNIAQLVSYSGLDVVEDQSGKHRAVSPARRGKDQNIEEG